MQPHPLQLPHYMLTFQGHEASQIYLFNSAVLVVALWLSRVLDLSCSKRWSTGCVASSGTRPLTPLVGKFSKSKVGPKKKFARQPARPTSGPTTRPTSGPTTRPTSGPRRARSSGASGASGPIVGPDFMGRRLSKIALLGFHTKKQMPPMPLWMLIGTPQSQGRRSRVGCMGAGSGEGGGGSFLDWHGGTKKWYKHLQIINKPH